VVEVLGWEHRVCVMLAGGGECLGASHPQYLQCTSGVSYILAHLCHHGSTVICWKIPQGE